MPPPPKKRKTEVEAKKGSTAPYGNGLLIRRRVNPGLWVQIPSSAPLQQNPNFFPIGERFGFSFSPENIMNSSFQTAVVEQLHSTLQ